MANIKLKDAFGVETVFHGIKQLKIPDAGGGTAEFNLESIPNLQIKDNLVFNPIAFTEENNNTYLLFQDGEGFTTRPIISPDDGYDGLESVGFRIKTDMTQLVFSDEGSENNPLVITQSGEVRNDLNYAPADKNKIFVPTEGTLSAFIDVEAGSLGDRYVTVSNNKVQEFRVTPPPTPNLSELMTEFKLTVYPQYPDVAMTYEYWQPSMVKYPTVSYARPEESYEGTPGDAAYEVGIRNLTLSEWFVEYKPDKISFSATVQEDGHHVDIEIKCYKGTEEIPTYFVNENTISAEITEDGKNVAVNWGSMAPLPPEFSTKILGKISEDGMTVLIPEIRFFYHEPTLRTNWYTTPSQDEKPL